MYVIKYTKSPRGYYVGYIKDEGRLHFFAATTESKLFERGVKSAYDNFRANATQVCMDARPMAQDDFPSHRIDFKWYAVWWSGMRKDGKPAATMTSDKRYSPVRRKIIVKEETKDVVKDKVAEEKKYAFHITRQVGNKLVVFGCEQVAEYDLDDKSVPAKMPLVLNND